MTTPKTKFTRRAAGDYTAADGRFLITSEVTGEGWMVEDTTAKRCVGFDRLNQARAWVGECLASGAKREAYAAIQDAGRRREAAIYTSHKSCNLSVGRDGIPRWSADRIPAWIQKRIDAAEADIAAAREMIFGRSYR